MGTAFTALLVRANREPCANMPNIFIEPKNRDFPKALKRYFPEGFSIQRELATAICGPVPLLLWISAGRQLSRAVLLAFSFDRRHPMAGSATVICNRRMAPELSRKDADSIGRLSALRSASRPWAAAYGNQLPSSTRLRAPIAFRTHSVGERRSAC
jgi:hypothetical protein